MNSPLVNRPPRQVADDIWLTEAPLNGVSVAIYMIRGSDTLAVVDTGYSYHPEAVILPALRRLGFAPEDVGLILNTHGHPDHLGGNASLQRHTSAIICLHGKDLPLAAGPEAHVASDTDHIMAMRALGWADEVAARETFIRERVEACTVGCVLGDGDRIPIGGGMSLHVIPTPGHSRGSVAFHIEERRLAIAGDAVQGWGVSDAALPLFYDSPAYAGSLDRIAGLKVETLCLGHNVRWPKSGPGSSPVRGGDEIAATLTASRQFVEALSRAAEGVSKSVPLADRVTEVARRLLPPFTVAFDGRGRISAPSAATIISHLGGPGAALEGEW